MRHTLSIVALGLFALSGAALGLEFGPTVPEPGSPMPLAGLASASTGPVAPPADEACGLETDLVPDFALVDQNPLSATYGQTWTRDAQLGRVLVIYWASAT